MVDLDLLSENEAVARPRPACRHDAGRRTEAHEDLPPPARCVRRAGPSRRPRGPGPATSAAARRRPHRAPRPPPRHGGRSVHRPPPRPRAARLDDPDLRPPRARAHPDRPVHRVPERAARAPGRRSRGRVCCSASSRRVEPLFTAPPSHGRDRDLSSASPGGRPTKCRTRRHLHKYHRRLDCSRQLHLTMCLRILQLAPMVGSAASRLGRDVHDGDGL